jgi:hypothetical protein
MSGVLPGGTLDVIRDQVTRLAAQGSGQRDIEHQFCNRARYLDS